VLGEAYPISSQRPTIIQCRARYETLKKGRVRETPTVDEIVSSRSPDDQGDEQNEAPEAIQPTPRKRAPAKKKRNQPTTLPFVGDSVQSDGRPTQPTPKRPRGRPPKAVQTREETPSTTEDGGSIPGRVQRPVPRKRDRPDMTSV
jgi:hypothetical protein